NFSSCFWFCGSGQFTVFLGYSTCWFDAQAPQPLPTGINQPHVYITVSGHIGDLAKEHIIKRKLYDRPPRVKADGFRYLVGHRCFPF
ncbi:hypothetical protein, partial [Yersinia intermedia]|uniref:hypothetical protein n=1 Tax=Yersinia intermedia TaxID=631 RepID=UPI0022443D6B